MGRRRGAGGRGSGRRRSGCRRGACFRGSLRFGGSPRNQDLQQEVVIGKVRADLLAQFFDGLQVSFGSPIEKFLRPRQAHHPVHDILVDRERPARRSIPGAYLMVSSVIFLYRSPETTFSNAWAPTIWE